MLVNLIKGFGLLRELNLSDSHRVEEACANAEYHAYDSQVTELKDSIGYKFKHHEGKTKNHNVSSECETIAAVAQFVSHSVGVRELVHN